MGSLVITEKKLVARDNILPPTSFVKEETLYIRRPPAPVTEGGILYYRTLTLDPATSIEGQQVLVTLTTENFDYSHCKEDGANLRFKSVEGASLSYWIHTWNIIGTSLVWVKVPNIGTDSIMLYYGEDVESESNGDAVFVFFDDFESVAIGQPPSGAKWTITAQGSDTVTVEQDPTDSANKVCRIVEKGEGTSNVVLKSVAFPSKGEYVVSYKLRLSAIKRIYSYLLEDAVAKVVVVLADLLNNLRFKYYTGSVYADFNPTCPNIVINTWYEIEDKLSLTDFDRDIDGINYDGIYCSTPAVGIDYFLLSIIRFDVLTAWIDNITVRQYPTSDPAVTVGSEYAGSLAEGGRLVIGRYRADRKFSVDTIYPSESEYTLQYIGKELNGFNTHSFCHATCGDYVFSITLPYSFYTFSIDASGNLTFISRQSITAYGAIRYIVCSGDILFMGTSTGVRSFKVQPNGSIVLVDADSHAAGNVLAVRNGRLYASDASLDLVVTCSFDSDGNLTYLDTLTGIDSPDCAIVFYGSYALIVGYGSTYTCPILEDGTLDSPSSSINEGGSASWGRACVEQSAGLLFIPVGAINAVRSYKISPNGELASSDSWTPGSFQPHASIVFKGALFIVGRGPVIGGIYQLSYDSDGLMTQEDYHADGEVINGVAYAGYFGVVLALGKYLVVGQESGGYPSSSKGSLGSYSYSVV